MLSSPAGAAGVFRTGFGPGLLWGRGGRRCIASGSVNAGLTAMVDFATIVSFVTGPVLGYLNLRVVTAPHVALEPRPGPALIVLSFAGLILLGGTAVVYLASLW